LPVLVTGAAGFIGFHTSRALLERGERVIGVDNLNDYYDVGLKLGRLDQLRSLKGFEFRKADISDRNAISAIFAEAGHFHGIIHLAAQAGVRYSLENPFAYADSNVMGQVVMLEAARRAADLRHFVYASSSSVYGANTELPFSIEHRVDRPISLYAATKRAGELMAFTYSHLYGLPTTGLRFFTVYGPWGRPDMAAFLFADAITEGRPIRLFNQGRMRRDFTYVDDIVAGILAALDRPPAPDGHQVPARLYNLGNSRTEELGRFVEILEEALGQTAVKELLPLQPGDVAVTSADIEASRRDLGFEPAVTIEDGLLRFVDWYRNYRSSWS
jgi:UDP-glucuronate 4-epimerase